MSQKTVDVLVNGARGSRRRGVSECRGCKRAIYWCASVAGKPIPFDENPDPIAVHGDIETVSADLVHWRTCPKRDEFRKPRPAPPADRALYEE